MKTTFVILLFFLSSCYSERMTKKILVTWKVTYTSGKPEIMVAHQRSILNSRGCMVDNGDVLRCGVSKIERVPLSTPVTIN